MLATIVGLEGGICPNPLKPLPPMALIWNKHAHDIGPTINGFVLKIN